MNRTIIMLIAFCLVGCNSDTDLNNDFSRMAGFETVYNPTLIQSGKEEGFLEPMMESSEEIGQVMISESTCERMNEI